MTGLLRGVRLTTLMLFALAAGLFGLVACSGGNAPGNSSVCGGGCGGGCGGCGGGEVDAGKVTEPAGWKPNVAGMDDAALLQKGLELWKDKSLSKAGNTSCETCHGSATALFKESFAKPFPHEVEMAKQKSGKASVSAAEMVQFCMVVPMGAERLNWDDARLAALARAVTEKQQEYKQATGK